MDPISVELRLALDMFKGDVDMATRYVEDKLGHPIDKGTSLVKAAADADKAAATTRSVISDIAKANQAMGGNVLGATGGSASFWAKNQHLLGGGGGGGGSGGGGAMGGGSDDSKKALYLRGMAAKTIAMGEMQRAKLDAAKIEEAHKLVVKNMRERASIQKKLAEQEQRHQRDVGAFYKNMSFLMMPLMNPGSPWGTLSASRQAFSSLSETQHGKGIMRNMGMPGVGNAALGAGALVAGATAMGFVLNSLIGSFKKLGTEVKEIQQAFKNSAAIYSKIIVSGGLGAGFVTQRMNLSRILGVDEGEVFKLNIALTDLAQRSAMATDSMKRNVGVLTGVELSKRITQLNNEASKAERGRFWSKLAEWNAKTDEWGSKFNLWTDKITNDLFEKLGFVTARPVQMPMARMNQMPGSAWESMGLVVGARSRNPGPAIERNTKRTADLMSELIRSMRKAFPGASVGNTNNPAFSNP